MQEIRNLTADEIDIRVGSISEKGVSFLLYKDARCDMNILDETFGIFGWQREHNIKGGKEFCTIRIYDMHKDEWIAKEDTGTESYTEKEKGQSSDAFKRAAFNIGIGRELYTSPSIFINLPTENINGRWQIKGKTPQLKVAEIVTENKVIKKLSIANKFTGEILFNYPNQQKTKSTKNAHNSQTPVNSVSDDIQLPICQECGQAILDSNGKTAKQIIDVTKQRYGKQLCINCYKKFYAREQQ